MDDFGAVDWVHFGRQVMGSRGFLGLSKKELGRATHVAPATITRIKNGRSDVGFPNAGAALQNYFERNGIEFPTGTSSTQLAFRGSVTNVAVVVDTTMPAGSRFQ